MHGLTRSLRGNDEGSVIALRSSFKHPLLVSRVQTSSPSYILLASLDAARAILKVPGFMKEPVAAAKVGANG